NGSTGDRSLPVTARLRSRFFITFGGPQAHGHSVEESVTCAPVTVLQATAPCRSRLGYGRDSSSPRVGRRPMGTPWGLEEDRAAAISRLKNFGKTHGLSPGGRAVRELRYEARP
ncbi:MAG: hypothetical protein ABSH09_21730, partial [Bryobacteraceae bacterium]